MGQPLFQLTLIPAGDEPIPENLERLQKELNALGLLKVSLDRSGAGGLGAVFGLVWVPTVSAFISTAIGTHVLQLMATVGPALGTALGAWLHARVGRKVRIKIGPDGFEAEAQTTDELLKLLLRAEEFQQRNRPKVIQES